MHRIDFSEMGKCNCADIQVMVQQRFIATYSDFNCKFWEPK
jgi:hypothetical protein